MLNRNKIFVHNEFIVSPPLRSGVPYRRCPSPQLEKNQHGICVHCHPPPASRHFRRQAMPHTPQGGGVPGGGLTNQSTLLYFLLSCKAGQFLNESRTLN